VTKQVDTYVESVGMCVVIITKLGQDHIHEEHVVLACLRGLSVICWIVPHTTEITSVYLKL